MAKSYNHILSDDFLEFKPVNATIRFANQNRGLALDESFVETLIACVNGEDRTGQLYELGHLWGESLWSKVTELALRTFNIDDIDSLEINRFQSLFADFVGRMGWGRMILRRRDDCLFVDLSHYLSPLVAQPDQRSRDFYAGFISGIYSQMSGLQLAAVCTGQDARGKSVTYLLDNEETIAAFEQHLGEGRSPADALALLQDGES